MTKVTITFEVDFAQYGGAASEQEAKNIVESMMEATTEWPWDFSTDNSGPEITIENFVPTSPDEDSSDDTEAAQTSGM